MNRRRIVCSIALLILIVGSALFSVTASGQSNESTAVLGGKELAGKKMFYQRCSVCHLPPLRTRTVDGKPYGPTLKGFVHDAESQHLALETIQRGAGGTMPGFQYGLRPEEIDDIVAYLRVYR